ncbi:MAG: D-alanine--D-alanine ligase, partial [Lachnospiraceae bacterium]|nr:D-alanine--D-alanine ligase [Lachnospiraceae bacterium]
AGLFEALPEIKPRSFDGTAPDLDQVRASRKGDDPSMLGPGVIEICRAADVVFMALHGANGEDGRIQAVFDLLGVPYTGSGHLGSAIAMDKIRTKEVVSPRGVRTPAWKVYDKKETPEDAIIADIKAPCVVKTPGGGSSLGVFVVRDQAEVEGAVRACLKYSPSLLVEELIEGREFTKAVLNGSPLPSVEIAPLQGGYDYSNKYVAGATREICPGRCTPEVEKEMGDMALQVHKILGLHTYSRSDFMVTDDGTVYFLEVNTLPGMTPTSLVPQEAAAVGIGYEDLCELIVEGAFDR